MADKILVYVIIGDMKVYGELDPEQRVVRLGSGREYGLTKSNQIRIGDNIYDVYPVKIPGH